MHTLEIEHKGRKHRFQIPESFDELSFSQLAFALPEITQYMELQKQLSVAHQSRTQKRLSVLLPQVHAIRFALLIHLSGVHQLPFFSPKIRAFRALDSEEAEIASRCIDWLFQKPQRLLPPKDRFFYQGRFYYAPGKCLENITGLEFHFASLHYQQYTTEHKEQDLDTLIAILYRPTKRSPSHLPRNSQFSGDRRIPFNPATLERDAARFSRLSKTLKSTILFYFSCSLQTITESHPRIFTKKSDSQARRFGWIPVFRSLAQDKLQLEKVWNLRMSRLLFEINQVILESDELKSKLSKNRS